MQSISEWLLLLGLDQYATIFADNDVDFDALRLLEEKDLQELGISLGHRKKLLKAIADLNGAETPTPVPSANAIRGKLAPIASPATEAERRQLTVLFCDMVGFTELANRVDPEVLQRIIGAYEDACAVCITRYEGYVFQRLGDGIVAFFGYPLAHEGEAERAIRAGLEINEALSKLDVPDAGHLGVRIGIATGVVVVSSAEKGAVGETMNLASRLQGIARSGSIVISERVRRLAGGSFEYEDLGEQALKGIAQPAHAYRIVGVSEAASRFEAATQEGLTPLVGREQEIGLLLERWQLAQDGEGQVVLLAGEPGIGKSRILSALRERLEGQGAQTLRFQCSPYYVNSAFWPSIDNFERALKFGRDEPMDSKLDKLEALIVTHYGCPLSDVRFVASILSIPCEERYGAISMTPQKHKDETLRALVDLTEAAARKQPSVLLYEDLHWADPTTLEVLDLLIDRVRDIPLLIVATHRLEFQNRWASHGHVVGLNLSRLTRAQSLAMVSRVAGGKALPPELLEQILTKTDGVPLFVEELTKSILESGDLKELGDHYEYSSTTRTITVPATLRDSLMARLDRAMPVKEIAQIGAAIGREFSYELISAVAPMRQAGLDDGLERLTESGLAFRRGTPPEATYTFKHALVQDAAYDSLLKSRRQGLHAKIARVIEERFPNIKTTEPEVLAHHYTQAGTTELALPFWQKAGESALQRMGVNEAIAHLTNGLTLNDSLVPSQARNARELELRTVLGTAWMAAGGWADPHVWSSYRPALDLARSLGRRDLLSPILWGLWVNVMCNGRIAESLQWANEMLTSAKEGDDRALEVTARMTMMVSSFWLGDFAAAADHGKAVSALSAEEDHGWIVGAINQDPRTTVGLFGSHWTWMLGFPDQAMQLCNAKDAQARDLGHAFNLGFALGFGSWVFDYRGEPEELLRHADECEKVGRENGLIFLVEMQAVFTRARALVRAGRLDEGVAMFERYFQSPMCLPVSHPYNLAVQAEALAHLHRYDQALERVNRAIEQIERPGWRERSHYAEVLRVRGSILALGGDAEGAEKNFFASLDWARKQQAKSWELRTSTSLARMWQSQGKRKEALDLLKPVYAWFTEGFDTKDLKDAKVLLDELA